VSNKATALLREALRLPVDQRAQLAANLLASVDGAPDVDAEAAWAKEIERRAKRAIAGESKGKDWKVVRARIGRQIRKG
jgi:putative addiction module component (TIGR02574 family)